MTKKIKKVEVPEVEPEVKVETEVVVVPPKKKRVKKPKVVEEVKPSEEKVEELPVVESSPEVVSEPEPVLETIQEPKPTLEEEITQPVFEETHTEAEVAPEPQPEVKKGLLDILKNIPEEKIPERLREKHRQVIASIEKRRSKTL